MLKLFFVYSFYDRMMCTFINVCVIFYVWNGVFIQGHVSTKHEDIRDMNMKCLFSHKCFFHNKCSLVYGIKYVVHKTTIRCLFALYKIIYKLRFKIVWVYLKENTLIPITHVLLLKQSKYMVQFFIYI